MFQKDLTKLVKNNKYYKEYISKTKKNQFVGKKIHTPIKKHSINKVKHPIYPPRPQINNVKHPINNVKQTIPNFKKSINHNINNPITNIIKNNKLSKNKDFLEMSKNNLTNDFKNKKLDNNNLKIEQDELKKNLNILQDKNKKEISIIVNQLKLYEDHLSKITKTINTMNNNFGNIKQKLMKYDNNNYITDVQLKKYFKKSNVLLSDLISKKFLDVEKKITNLEKKDRILKLKNKILDNKPEFSENIKAKEIKNIEFEYLGYNLIVNNGKNEKIAFIAKTGSEKIYTVSLETEIENKYKIVNLDSKYLYIKNILNNTIYKLHILDD